MWDTNLSETWTKVLKEKKESMILLSCCSWSGSWGHSRSWPRGPRRQACTLGRSSAYLFQHIFKKKGTRSHCFCPLVIIKPRKVTVGLTYIHFLLNVHIWHHRCFQIATAGVFMKNKACSFCSKATLKRWLTTLQKKKVSLYFPQKYRYSNNGLMKEGPTLRDPAASPPLRLSLLYDGGQLRATVWTGHAPQVRSHSNTGHGPHVTQLCKTNRAALQSNRGCAFHMFTGFQGGLLRN